MKKQMVIMTIGALTIGTAAQAWWPFGSRRVQEPVADKTEIKTEARQIESLRMRQPAQEESGLRRMSEARAERIRQEREEISAMSEAYRTETDPAGQEKIKQQLRVKLNEIEDRMEERHKRRLEAIQAEMQQIEARMKEVREKREQRIEDRIKRILAGEPLRRSPQERDASSRRPSRTKREQE